MKIAFDSQAFTMQEYGGISRYFCSLVAQLEKFSEIELKIFAPFYINTYLEKVSKNLVFGVKVPKIPKTGRISQIINQLVARPAIHKFNPQIVHETYYSKKSVAPKDACRVVTVYDMIHEHFPSVFAARDLTSELKRAAVKRADHVICISENTRRDLIDFFQIPSDKISVVYLGYDEFPIYSEVASALDRRVQSAPYLLYVGGRGGYKNFTGLLKAYASSNWLRNNVRLICFGGGRFESKELDLIKVLGLSENHVMQIGGSDAQLAGYYRNATAFVYPSLYEGFGIPPLEAMSLNCPVICSNTSSIPEVVGRAAEYFSPDDIESMRSAIESVLQSEQRRNELIRMGAEQCKDFSWSRCASETLAVYQRVI